MTVLSQPVITRDPLAGLGTSANLDVVKKKKAFRSGRKDARAYGHSARRLDTLSVMLNDPCSVDEEITVEIKFR
jgi:hypothetical protein